METWVKQVDGVVCGSGVGFPRGLREAQMVDVRKSKACLTLLSLVCMLLVIAVSSKAPASESSEQTSLTDADNSAVASLPKWHGQSASVAVTIDLTQPFETQTHWTFVAATLAGPYPDALDGTPIDGGSLAQCFVNDLTAHCRYATPPAGSDPSSDAALRFWFSTPVKLYSAQVVYAGADNTRPLLLIQTGAASGGDGSHSIYTELFTYDRPSNKFKSVFSNSTGSNNNQKTRFLEQGPLRGDVIVDDPTSSAPFGYWISVYALKDDTYSRSLRYRSATHYGDGNRLSVIDSEMPGILRRMGLWKAGGPLPAPPGCSHPVLRHGEEWCE